jgi:hypothetical protein
MEPIKDRTPTICKITKQIPSLFKKYQNETLTRPITQEEVDQEIKEIPPGKPPGLDGFTTYLFHYCWSLIQEEVSLVVDESGTSGKLQCHLPHFNPKGIKGNPSQRISSNRNLQCDLHNHHEAYYSMTKTNLSLHHI